MRALCGVAITPFLHPLHFRGCLRGRIFRAASASLSGGIAFMIDEPVIHIRCPACEYAVRALDDAPCPNCGRCPSCGRKLKTDQPRCGCAVAESPDIRSKFIRSFIIPEELVAREARRMEIRKQLEMKRAIVSGLTAGSLIVFANVRRDVFGPFTWTTFGVYLVCVVLAAALLTSFVNWMFRKIEDSKLQTDDVRSKKT